MNKIDNIKVTFLSNLDLAEKFRNDKELKFEYINKSHLSKELKIDDDWFHTSELVILRIGEKCKILKSRY